MNNSGFEYWRYRVVYILLAAVILFFAVKLFDMQILNGDQYKAQADENRLKEISVQTTRGTIYDRNGFVLAQNVPSYDVSITPAYLPADTGSLEKVYRELSALIDVPVTNGTLTDANAKAFTACQTDFGIKEIVIIGDTNAPYSPVKIKCNVDEKIALQVKSHASDWPGVGVDVESIRSYPTGSLTAAVIGFLGPITAEEESAYTALGFKAGRDKVGYAGVELSMDATLRGTNGTRLVEVDNGGKVLKDAQAPVDPIAGNNVVLTIDTRLQAAAQSALTYEMDYWNTRLGKIRSQNGVVIAMNPKTGEILAMVSYPSYENNRMARVIPAYYYNQLNQDPLHPLLNHAISSEFPPGSVYKMAAAIGALNEGVVTPDEQIACPGSITVMNTFSINNPGSEQIYYSYDRSGHGTCDFLKGVSLSDDVYFYKIGGGYQDEVPNGGLNVWRLQQYAQALGYGAASGIELPGEVKGLVPDPTWKRVNQTENWSVGDTYIATIGQGYVIATPLQVLESFATLANNGAHMKPTIIKEITDSQGNVIQPFTPTLLWDITKDPVINVLDDSGKPTGEKKVVEPWVIDYARQGMREVVVSGTSSSVFKDTDLELQSAGKTGTAEYCDDVAQEKNLCKPELWPTHAWYTGYAPYDNPEIVVTAFVYNGGEGATVAAPIVQKVLQAYYDLKQIDAAAAGSASGQ